MTNETETPAAEAAAEPAGGMVSTAEARAATAGVLRNIAGLLRRGQYAGSDGRQVAEAIGFLEHMANQYHGAVKVEKAEKKRAKKTLKAVKNG